MPSPLDFAERAYSIPSRSACLEAGTRARLRHHAPHKGLTSQGYSRSKISSALTESDTEVRQTIALLLAVHDVYDAQLRGYAELVEQVGHDPDFATRRAEEPPDALERRKSAQIALVQEHERLVGTREQLLAASKKALQEVAKVHQELVEEAARDRKEFDVPKLVQSAQALSGEVADFRDLVSQLAPR